MPCLTVEVDPRRRCIVQIRGPSNDRKPGVGHTLVRMWAEAEGLSIAATA